MKVFIRKATIDPVLRESFERYGVLGMQIVLATTNTFRHNGRDADVRLALDALMPWITE